MSGREFILGSPRRFLLLALLGFMPACGGTGVMVELDPLHVEGVDLDGNTEAVVLEPEWLFVEAGRAFEQENFHRAAALYVLLVERFPGSPWAGPGRFNAGLTLERLERWSQAVPHFEEVARRSPGTRDAHDARLHQATCMEHLERWEELIVLWDGIVASTADSAPLDSIEAYARRGFARRHAGQLALAERDFKEAFSLHRDHLGEPGMERNPHITMARFQVGEIYRELFEEIRFQLPMEQMARDLEDKSNLFLKAQAAYLRAIRFSHSDWSPRAGFRLGALYETLYEHMMAADIPADLPDKQVMAYFQVLRDKIRPLIEQAVDIYERNIHLTERLGGSEEWRRRSRASLARLREVLREELTRDALKALRGR